MKKFFNLFFLKGLFPVLIFISTNSLAQLEEKIDPSVYLKENVKQGQDGGSSSISATILNKELNATPVSPLLPGYLFEMGYGDMESGLWAEMIFNRQFEPFPPYKTGRDWWYGLRERDREKEKREGGIHFKEVNVDWREMGWYHSGYEHSTWYAAPGEVNDYYIDEESTLFQLENEEGTSLIELLKEDAFMGQYARVKNVSSKDAQGIAQNGKYIRKGMGYTFKGYFRAVGKAGAVTVSLFPQGSWKKPVVSTVIDGLNGNWQEKTVRFENLSFEGFTTLVISLKANSAADMDALSLMPDDNINGWRKDAVEMTRDDIKPGVLRWPGGCYASYYKWKDGIGTRDKRPVRVSGHWGGFAYNDVGTLEYLDFCEKTGTEPFICLNLFHPKKEWYYYYFPDEDTGKVHGYHFKDIIDLAEGAQLAAEWVAYCNLPAGSHPMADLRAKHGCKEQAHVKYWELENEAWRWFSNTEDYAKACIVYSKAIKAIDPTVKLGISTYGKNLSDSLESVLSIAGKYIDFLADRGVTEENVSRKIGIIRDYNKKHNTDIKYTNTEFFATSLDKATIDAQKKYNVNNGKGRNLKTGTWGYALSYANIMMQWQRYGGDVIFGCFNSFANDHLNSVIETPKEGTFLKYPAAIGKLFRETPARWVLETEGYEPSVSNSLQVQAAWDENRQNLVVFIYNTNSFEGELALNLSKLGKKFRYSRTTNLIGSKLETIRSVKEPNKMVEPIISIREINWDNDTWNITVQPGTFIQVEFSEKIFNKD